MNDDVENTSDVDRIDVTPLNEPPRSKVVPLDAGASVLYERGEPNKHLIERLEQLLGEARDGRLRNFIGCGKTRDGWLTNCWAGDVDYERFAVLGGLTLAQHRLASRINED